MITCNGLSSLDLSYCPSSSIKMMQEMIDNGKLNDLRKFSLKGSLTDNAETNADLLSSLTEVVSKRCLHIEELDLSENCINMTGAAALGNLISNIDYHKGSTSVLDVSIIFGWKTGYSISLNNTQYDDKDMSAFIKVLQSSERHHDIRLLSLTESVEQELPA